MQKNRRTTREKMFQAVEAWQSSGQTKQLFCKDKSYSKSTFYYWLKKHQEKQSVFNPSYPILDKGFLPVKLSTKLMESPMNISRKVDIHYPNGVWISCPSDLKIDELRALINL